MPRFRLPWLLLALVLAAPAAAGREGHSHLYRVGPGRLRAPAGMALLPDGTLLVSQFGGTPALVRVGRDGSTRFVDTGPAGLWGLVATPSGRLYGTDLAAGRLLVRGPGEESWTVLEENLQEPSGLAFHRGYLYLAERSGRVRRRDPRGTWTTLATDLRGAEGLAVAGGRLYVSLPTEDRVVSLDRCGGEAEDFVLDLSLPTALAAGPESVLVAEGATGQVWEYRLEEQGRRRLVGQAEPGVTALAVLPDGGVAATCIASGTLWRLDPWAPDSRPIVAGGISTPGSLRVEPISRLLATGITPAEFDSAGKVIHTPLLRSLYEPGERLWGVTDSALGRDGTQIYTFAEGGRVAMGWGAMLRVVAEGMDHPTGALVTDEGQIYVAESGAGRVVALAQGGVRIPIAGSLGEPVDLAAAPGGGIYVVDRAGGRLLRVDDRGTRVLRSDLARPEALALLPGGDLAVLESDTGRVLRVDPRGEIRGVFAEVDPALLRPPDRLAWQAPAGLAFDPATHSLYLGTPGNRGVLSLPLR